MEPPCADAQRLAISVIDFPITSIVQLLKLLVDHCFKMLMFLIVVLLAGLFLDHDPFSEYEEPVEQPILGKQEPHSNSSASGLGKQPAPVGASGHGSKRPEIPAGACAMQVRPKESQHHFFYDHP